jgi:hypothetical protein
VSNGGFGRGHYIKVRRRILLQVRNLNQGIAVHRVTAVVKALLRSMLSRMSNKSVRLIS